MELPDLTGKVAVITGASRGLGAGLAKDFLARGMKVALSARSPQPFEDGEHVLTRQFDVSDPKAMAEFSSAAVAQFGQIDLWINNAGIIHPVVKARDLDGPALYQSLDVNVLGVLYGSQNFVRHVESRSGEGVLLNISSGAAYSGMSGWAAYCMGKASVDRLTETFQLEEAEHGVRCYSVAPGIIDTDMQAQIRDCKEEVFPNVAQFHEYKAQDLYNTVRHVAKHLLQMAFAPSARPDTVSARIPAEKG
ncbi:MAG: SDR family oxidoreductase [Planctomycetes bacterium]|nr:SDR family oxidoreductase [Planctomycetota bacterium]MCP4772001.1 SDR family oxidoreductase [Planctomycetota bacterium]MCP4860259.1 SDR family oxidoreductase [Planctomycetota bacterium]